MKVSSVLSNSNGFVLAYYFFFIFKEKKNNLFNHKIFSFFLRLEECDGSRGKKAKPVTQYQNSLLFHNWIIGIPMVFENLIIVIPHGVIISSFPSRHEN